MTYVNRVAELSLLQATIDRIGPTESVVALVKAPADLGKSALLDEFIGRHLDDERWVATVSSLKPSSEVSEVMGSIAVQLESQDIELPRYSAARDSPTPTFMTISDSDLSEVQFYVNVELAGRRWDQMLLHGLADDLRAAPDVTKLIVIDSFQSAGEYCESWITEQLVPAAKKIPNLLLVVLGQRIPRLQAKFRAGLDLTLRVFDPDVVERWLRLMGATYPESQLRAIAEELCTRHEGVPGRIALVLSLLEDKRWPTR
jgi:hypothetical protein